MTSHRLRATLPIRRWLAIALALIVIVPVAVVIIVGVTFVHRTEADSSDIASRLEANAARWHDPVWQSALRDDLASQGVYFLLIEDGREVYRSAADPLTRDRWGPPGRVIEQFDFAGSDPSRSAFIYTDEIPLATERVWLLPAVLVATLLLTLTVIAWFLRRAVLAPLAATERAALSVAGGDLDVDLPSSRVSEVAEVNAAFEGMSDALRASLMQQTRLEQERRMFISAIAHDLRTPLFSLRGYLEGLDTGIADTPEAKARYVAVAREKAAALERLVADLFDYTRLEYLDQAPERETTDLAVLLRDLVDSLQPMAEASHVALAMQGAPGPCLIDADRRLLTRAIENLLDNALRYTPSGGHVRVTCHAGPSGASFSVADSGPGIRAEDLPNLFTPLYRGETSRNRQTGGAGLGLTIARRILQAHGGELTAANGAEGGAVFTGSLPASAAPLSETIRSWSLDTRAQAQEHTA
ncbi:MAG TPA: HAMP domain-containing sensor histidine kinase [Thermomicrobiales bacterium]|nr:HAMP domain-containing sensor histidine kinase [Thermomicrobiales bacterium]